MSPSLVHAHDSRIHFKLDEIDRGLRDLGADVWEAARAYDKVYLFTGANRDVDAARVAVTALMDRRQEIAADIAILREMLGVR